MNCQMSAWVYSEDPAVSTALQSVEAWMQEVEQTLSRFRPTSDLSRLNAQAGHPYPASDILWQVTRHALEAARRTEGLFDPTSGQALIASGYDRSFEQLRQQQQASPFQARATFAGLRKEVGVNAGAWKEVVLDEKRHTITLPAGVQLDLGGIAKGWAADQALRLLARWGPALIDAGGDIAVGEAPPQSHGWMLGVADPLDPENDLALLELANAGLASSGTDHRRWQHRGRQQHHIIDPATAAPAETDILNASVIAPSAREADVTALVLVLLGTARGESWLKRHQKLATLVVLNDGRPYHTPEFFAYVKTYYPKYPSL